MASYERIYQRKRCLKMSSKKSIISFISLLAMTSLISACSGNPSGTGSTPSSEKSVVLKGVTAWEENNIHSAGFGMFQKKIEEQSNGRIKVQYAGGPESIPAFNQGDAVRTGVVDFSVLSTAYYQNQVPEAVVTNYSELSVEEEWKNGSMAFLNEIHNKKLNAQFIGRSSGMSYSLYTKKPITSIDDLKGKRFRTSPVYVPFIKALGAEAVIMPAGEIYTAIERGVIDGVAWPKGGVTDLGLQKQIKYQISPSYWKVDTSMIMNLDRWKQLSKEDQDLINKVAREVEKELPLFIEKFIEDEQKKLKEAGIQEVKLPEEEYLKIANDSAWKWVETNLPENGKKLEELFRKK
ncbi:TRAP transporter substrate-binding protein DctP [Paenibacillus validus]|uniref:C4-dicarboxylate ABC transporter substrate-binding protein n=1 Tax=Paenibacillus validus TaxID=44253 RepID=A0A7X2ZCK7_9BACL|nr:TRAP transporter substrate-binding protein DctP [Paenibacillus validus]MUG72377.1 hypothetical protein [Paenibacillus validus]